MAEQYICIVYYLIDYDKSGTPNFSDINPDMSGVFSDNGRWRVGRVGLITVNEQKFYFYFYFYFYFQKTSQS